MKIESPWVMGLGGLLASAAVRAWMGTLEGRAALYDSRADPAARAGRQPRIYIFWHEYILYPLFLRQHCNIAMLLSRHRDAEVLSRAARQMGFQFVRGSTQRGGVAALRAMLRTQRDIHLAITPDGPRGPRRTMAPGAVFLASRLGLPLIAMGFGFDRPWRVRSAWDQFAIPRPFSRARAIVSPEIRVPAELGRDELEHFRVRVEGLLQGLTEDAERWALSGARRAGEISVGPARATGPWAPVVAEAAVDDPPVERRASA